MWADYEKEQESTLAWLTEYEMLFRNQPLQASFEDKQKHLDEFKNKCKCIVENEKAIDSFMDLSLIHI